jgi:hypothetical protein
VQEVEGRRSKAEEEKTTLEGMIQSHDELIVEMDEEYGLNHMGENDDDDEGNAVTPLAPLLATVPDEAIEEEAPMEMVLEQETPMAHEVILVDAEPKLPQPHLFNMIMRDYKESSMMTQMKTALTWMSGFPKMGVMIEIESSSLSL